MVTISDARRSPSTASDGDLLRTQLPVHGLMCVADAVRLEHELTGVCGVHKVTVNPVTEAAYITFDPLLIGRGDLMAAIVRAGFRTGY